MKLLPPSAATSVEHPRVLLDESQLRAVEVVESGAPVVAVAGAPGTGKTTCSIRIVERLISNGVSPSRIVVLSASRQLAGDLRNSITSQLQGAVGGTVVRTAAAFAFSILSAAASARREPLPRLITGPEQDQLLAELLQGYVLGDMPGPHWPASIPPETLELRGFRAELRDLFMRAAENGLDPTTLKALGDEYDRPEWVAAAHVFRDYQLLTTFATMAADAGKRYDPAQIVDDAAAELSQWPGDDKPSWDYVIVDDYQEATAATVRLLTVLRRSGTKLVLLGDPDVAVQGFRGARPGFMGSATAGDPDQAFLDQERLGHFGAELVILERVHRGSNYHRKTDERQPLAGDAASQLRQCVQRVTHAIASLGVVKHRAAQVHPPREVEQAQPAHDSEHSIDTPRVVRAAVFETPDLEAQFIARILRSAHLRDGMAWTDMAVIARSGAQLVQLRRALATAGVPVAVAGTDIPLRDEPAVRPLLQAIESCHKELNIDEALELVTSVIGGADAIQVRKIRRALRTLELRAGGGRTSDELILEAVADLERARTIGSVGTPLVRVAHVLAEGKKALAEPGATPQTVLWAVWDATGLAEQWQRAALSGSAAASRADRDLDAVMSLFRAAETYVDRLPESGALDFVQFLNSQDIPADSLATQMALGGKVALLTPPGAAGLEWPLVCVAGVQEGQWPDLRLRDSLLGAQTLVELLSGRATQVLGLGTQARKEVFYDELRAFAMAVSRASGRLYVTAVKDEENEPSVFLTLVSPPEPGGSADNFAESLLERALPQDVPLSLRSLTAVARAELIGALESGDDITAQSRVELLRYLADNGVDAAMPSTWYGARPLSSYVPLFADRDTVPLSPSRVDAIQRCALRWTLETSGGTHASGLSQNIGNLIHAIAADYPQGRLTQLLSELDRRWPQLRLPEGFTSRKQYDLAVRMLTKLADYYRIAEKNDVQQVLVEQPFSIEVEGARINGAVDRVEIDSQGHATIVDLKTGKTAPTAKETETNPQLGIYQLALMEGAFGPDLDDAGAKLLYVATTSKSPTTRVQPPLPDPKDNWARTLVHDTVEVIRSATFTAQENTMCPHCPVRRSCPLQAEGQYVVPTGITEVKTGTPLQQREEGENA